MRPLKWLAIWFFEYTDEATLGPIFVVPLAEKHYSVEFRVRIPPMAHRSLAKMAAEQGISLNRLASAKLAG
jgi:hypothetical protein